MTLPVNDRQAAGRRGEALARSYLAGEGYGIVASNARTAFGEIDLVAQQDNTLVFVEVKARRSNSLGPPEISISRRKRAHMLAAAQAYIQELPEPPESWRIDVIAVRKLDAREPEIVHFENAISP